MNDTLKSVVQRSSNGLVVRLDDGTVASKGAVYTKSWQQRLAIVNAIIGSSNRDEPHVEIELRGGRALICDLLTAAYSNSGTTRDVVVVREADMLVPTVYSLALVRSISELTLSEWAQRVAAMSDES